MKSNYYLFLLIWGTLFTFKSLAQVNETPMNRYVWDGKSTVPREGYVVLKSGTRMEGTVSLKGDESHVKEIILIKDGKEIKFKPESLKAYGIKFQPLTNDTDGDLYEWVDGGVVMGKVITKTKSRNGYVILATGDRVEGDLSLRKTDEVFDQIILKSANGKGKYELAEVNNYGLLLTIAEMTNNGKKIRKDFALNYHEGYVALESGMKLNGWIAFKKATVPNALKPLENAIYEGIYYTPEEKGLIELVPADNVIEVMKKAGDSILYYAPMGDGTFSFQKNSEDVSGISAARQLQKGRIVRTDETEEEGEVAVIFLKGSQYADKIRFRQASGIVTQLTTDEVKSFVQIIHGKTQGYIGVKNRFVKLDFDGNTLRLFRNPFPTSINQFKTSLAKTSAEVGGSIAAGEMARSGDRKGGWESNIDSIINTMSNEELLNAKAELRDRFGGTEEQLSENAPESMRRYYTAINIKLASRAIADNVVVMNKEWIMLNKKTGDQTIIIKDTFKKSIEPVLMGCEAYLMMDKKEQAFYRDFDKLQEIMELLDKCYK